MSPHPESQLPPGWVNRRCLPTNASLKFLASQDLDDKSSELKSSLINTREREGLYLSFDTFLLIHGPLHTLICSGPWLIFAPNTQISLSSSSLLSSRVIPRDSLRASPISHHFPFSAHFGPSSPLLPFGVEFRIPQLHSFRSIKVRNLRLKDKWLDHRLLC